MAEAALEIDVEEVQAALRVRNPQASITSLKNVARIVSITVDAMSSLSPSSLRQLARDDEPLRAALRYAARGLVPADAKPSNASEPTQGSGLGELLSLPEGRARLAAYATPRPLEEWAGPVGGAGELKTQFGIKGSTLNSWFKQGAVVGLLRGQRKLFYPLEQFIDGRPLQGISDVLSVAPDARSAWLWLRQPHVALDGGTPLASLRRAKPDLVREVALRDFDRKGA